MKRYELKRDRGPFTLVIGRRKLRFRDAAHFGEACVRISRGRFASALDLVTYARALPNGYSSFIERTD